ncbi:MAG: ASCH domain-containing protein [Candidatus Korarchaeota archaeon]|nr:ASCH domain-containing protein [Candidatus Korarchaeota archaeon]
MGRKKSLRFDRRYVDSILRGEKVTTIRRTTRLRPGDVVDLVAGEEVFGEALVKDVRKVSLSGLTDEEARRDGFESKEGLVKALKRYYGRRVLEDDQLWMIEFQLLEGSDKNVEGEGG